MDTKKLVDAIKNNEYSRIKSVLWEINSRTYDELGEIIFCLLDELSDAKRLYAVKNMENNLEL